MLYLFDVVGTPCIKLGYTNGCPWDRARDGFWRLVHPASCCGNLGWDNLELIYYTPGERQDEAAIKELVPPLEGEFWDREQKDMLTLALKVFLLQTYRHLGNEDWMLPLPPKPTTPAIGRGIEKRPCCGGHRKICYKCGAPFILWIHLQTHMNESCPHREAHKVDCGTCGKRVLKRNLKRHIEDVHEAGHVE